MAGDTKQNETSPLADTKPKGDLESLAEHVKTHPTQYALSVGFIVLCALAGYVYQVQTSLSERKSATDLASALDIEDPSERAETLSSFTATPSKFTPDGLYIQGESYFRAQEYASAAAAFERLRAEYPDFRFVPDAVEGLGFIQEEDGDYAGALARYREVLDKWPESFAGYRQSYNIGRCEERIGNVEEAIVAYRQQVERFPGSNISGRAQHALHTLELRHPDIFEQLDEASAAETIDTSAIKAPDTLLGDE